MLFTSSNVDNTQVHNPLIGRVVIIYFDNKFGYNRSKEEHFENLEV